MRVIALLAMAIGLITAPSLAWAQADGPAAIFDIEKVPEACHESVWDIDELSEVDRLERVANCISYRQDIDRDQLDYAISLYQRIGVLNAVDKAAVPQVDGPRFNIICAYGLQNHVKDVMREAALLDPFLASSPDFRCDFFDGLNIAFTRTEMANSALALGDKYRLDDCPRFVPRSGWSEARRGASLEQWLGNQMRAMEEESFSTPQALEKLDNRFRLTVMPSFRPAFSARFESGADGSVALHWVILDGAGGYSPGEIADRGVRRLTEGEAQDLARVIARASLFQADQQQEDLGGIKEVERPDGTVVTTFRICLDGSKYLFEQIASGQGSFVERSCAPSDETLFELLLTVYDLLPRDMIEEWALEYLAED